MEKKRQPNNTFTPIGQVLESILDQCRSNSGGGILHLVHVWEKAVGPPISDNAKPFAVKGSLLLVHVSSSAWLHQLRFLKADLLEKVNQGLENERIEDIKFKIGLV
jgi:predicted nucleic acid-binding Zn ribbon protein